MKLQNIPFTEVQTESIYKFLSYIDECNKDILSNCKISGLEMKVSVSNNFFCSYYKSYFGDSDGIQGDIKYVEIDKYGNEIDLMETYRSENEIIFIMEKMQKIEL